MAIPPTTAAASAAVTIEQTTGPTAQVNVYIGDGAKKTLDIDRGLNHVFTPVSGIGDECVEETGGIFFRKGDVWAQISIVVLSDKTWDDLRPGMEQLAKKVVGQL
jgi:hypothetical protein